MPFDVTSDQLIPTLLLNPDTRFATSFLDVKFRKYSVTGEAIIDKSTGELYFRRNEDGKLVSFSQDYRDLYDQVWQLNIVKANNPGFTYPSDDSKSLFLSTNYDLGCINNEENVFVDKQLEKSNGVLTITNFAETDSATDEVAESIDAKRTFQFKIASDTKGYFAKVTTRASDKLAVEYLSKVYNNIFGDLDGDKSTDEVVEEENANFSNSYFEKMNAKIEMSIRLSASTEKSIDYSEWVRLNAPSYIDLTEPITQLLEDLPEDEEYTITVYINKIDPYKIRRVFETIDTIKKYDTGIETDIDSVLYIDKQIGLVNTNIMHFVDKVSDILPLGNESIISTFDINTMKRVLGEIESIRFRPAIIVSALQPDPSEWAPGVLWGERVTDIDMVDGSSYDAGSIIDVDWLASRVNFTATGYTKIGTDPESETDILYTDIQSEEESVDENTTD